MDIPTKDNLYLNNQIKIARYFLLANPQEKKSFGGYQSEFLSKV